MSFSKLPSKAAAVDTIEFREDLNHRGVVMSVMDVERKDT